jgi:hypothetical protein
MQPQKYHLFRSKTEEAEVVPGKDANIIQVAAPAGQNKSYGFYQQAVSVHKVNCHCVQSPTQPNGCRASCTVTLTLVR